MARNLSLHGTSLPTWWCCGAMRQESAALLGPWHEHRRPAVCGGRCSFDGVNLAVLSIGFAFIFLAYNTVQNYVTSLLPDELGNNSLATVYAVASLSAFVAPPLVAAVGPRATMLLGGACYALYMTALIRIVDACVLSASALLGFGAAVLWVGFGVYVSDLGRGKAHYIGIFWSVFQLSNVVGNLGGYAVFDHASSSSWFYATFATVAGVGVVGLLALRPIPNGRHPRHQNGGGGDGGGGNVTATRRMDEDGHVGGRYNAGGGVSGSPRRASGSRGTGTRGVAPSPSARASDTDLLELPPLRSLSLSRRTRWRDHVSSVHRTVKATCRLMVSADMALVLPMSFWTGFELSFWTGSFTQLLDKDVIGLVMAFTGVGEVVTGWVLGWAADKWGRSQGFVAGTLVYGAALLFTAALRGANPLDEHGAGPMPNAPWLAFAAALCFGIGDSAFNTQTYAVLSHRWSNAHAYTLFNLAQNAGSAVGFYYSDYLPLTVHRVPGSGSVLQLVIQAAVMLAATLCVLVLERRRLPHASQRR